MREISEEVSFIMNLWTINTMVSKKVDGYLGAVHGIGFTEYMVLFHLSNAHKQSLRRVDLANLMGVTASGITRLVSPMEKIGLVIKEANPRDARVSLVKLAPSGEAILTDSTVSLEHTCKNLLAGVKQSQILNSIKVFEALNKSNGIQ